MPSLFMIYIGGAHPQSLVEVHDIRFVVANQVEETYESLRKSWWGTPSSLHLDAWGILDEVDGYKLHLQQNPAVDSSLRLYFVNLGGYDAQQFTELHQNVVVVASNEEEAKQKALTKIQHWEVPHRDYLHDIDTLLDLNTILAKTHDYLRLEKTSTSKPFEFICRYTPIGK